MLTYETDRTWFSYPLWHPATKQSGLFLQPTRGDGGTRCTGWLNKQHSLHICISAWQQV